MDTNADPRADTDEVTRQLDELRAKYPNATIFGPYFDSDEKPRPTEDWMDKTVADWQTLAAEHPDWTDAEVSAAYEKGEHADG